MQIKKVIIPAARTWNTFLAGNKSDAERNAADR